MSIFKDTFRKPIQDQITARQDALLQRTPVANQYYNSRNAWVRMTSAIEVKGDGGALAKKYILQGGILSEDGKLRSGLDQNDGSYSNTTPSGVTHRLGIRPMPGITDIDIKTKGTYGSLREAVINIKCWDIHQLEDLELLYMRPGYTILLEWGWTPYLKNDGSLEPNIEFIDEVVSAKKNDPNNSKEKIYEKLFKKASVDGNYDAMYGFIKNYSWKARMDGGYDCTVTMTSIGDILESLKINYTAADTDKGRKGVFGSTGKDGFDVPFEPNSTLAKAYGQNVLAGIFSELFLLAKHNAKGSSGTGDDIAAAVVNIITFGGVNTKILNEMISIKTPNGDTYDIFKTDVDIAHPDDKTKDTVFSETGEQMYITLGDLAKILNKYVLLQDASNKSPMSELSLTEGNHMTNPGQPLLCLGSIFQLSTDPTICVIKNPAWANPEDLGFDKLSNDSTYLKELMTKLKQNYWYNNDFKEKQLGIIQNIYVNLGYLYSLSVSGDIASQDKTEKNDISLFEFLKSMLNGINRSIGNVANFDVFMDPQDNKTRIIDVNYTDPKKSTIWDQTYELQVHNLKSIVRNYSFESKMFAEQGTQVAIAAQNGGEGTLGENVETLIDFNQNLEDRIIPKKLTPFPLNAVDEKTALENKIKNLKANLDSLSYYVTNLNPGTFETTGDFDAKEAGKYANALKDTISFFNSILKFDNKNRSIVPTKFSCELDGIGGIVIGQLFKIPPDMLPRGYKGLDGVGPAKMAYAVTGLGHTVKENNDWVTKIDAQIIILDEPKGKLGIRDIKAIKSIVQKVEEKNIKIDAIVAVVNSVGSTVGGESTANNPAGQQYRVTPPYKNLVTSAKKSIGFSTAAIPGTSNGRMGCAVAASVMFLRATGYQIKPGQDLVFSTYELFPFFEKSSNFKMKPNWKTDAQPGDIIVTQTNMGGGKTVAGHIGIVIDTKSIDKVSWDVISNSSGGFSYDKSVKVSGGSIQLNYTVNKWQNIANRNPTRTACFTYVGPYAA